MGDDLRVAASISWSAWTLPFGKIDRLRTPGNPISLRRAERDRGCSQPFALATTGADEMTNCGRFRAAAGSVLGCGNASHSM
jgi:hypothetical protein